MSPRARILKADAQSIETAAELIRRGGIVGMPTETVYGLAGSALDPEALAKIFEAKERPTFDPLIVHVEPSAKDLVSLERLGLVNAAALSSSVQAQINALIAAFWPGPLTLVLPKQASVPDLCTSGLLSVALRMPRHPVAQELIRATGTPLAAPSANRFGRISPTTALAVMEELGDRIELILDGGPCEVGVESTVVEVPTNGPARLLRPGGIPRSEIETILGVSLEVSITPGRVEAPGMLESHYAPQKPLYLLPKPARELQAHPLGEAWRLRSAGIILLSANAEERATAEKHLSGLLSCPVEVLALSESGDLHEIARNLFSTLRKMDSRPVDAIFVETCPPNHGLGHAIADRLRRASAKRPLR